MKTWFPVFLVALLLALAEGFAEGQQRAKVPRVAYLGGTAPRLFEAFQQGLRELDYVEGHNIIVERGITQEDTWALHSRAAELVRLKPEVIVAASASAADATLNATRTIPIVLTDPGVYPVAAGLVATLERPGGNVTGVSGLVSELGGKWLDLLKEAIPSIRRVVVLWSRRSEDKFPTWKGLELAARSLQVDLLWLEVRNQRDLARAFRPATYWGRMDAFIVLPGGIFGANRSEIVDRAIRSRLPGIFWREDFADEGGLMAYGANRLEQSRRAAYVVHKILKGAKPADLPVERPTQFELVINLKAAKALGLKIPAYLLMEADRVIE